MGASDRDKMAKAFDSLFRRSLFLYKCWAQTSAEVILTHDDFVWSGGPFLHPDIYRQVFLPRYAELWKVVRDAGKKVLFCSDGDFTEFAEEVVDAGADGLIFEPMNDFDFLVDRLGQRACLVGSFVDCRDMTFGSWEQVKAAIDRTFDRLADCRGAIVSVGNHLPANIPESMLERYFAAVVPRLQDRA
jgi:uroporphyrinogen-III decarboxylase